MFLLLIYIFPPPLTLFCVCLDAVFITIQSGFQCAQLAADVYSNSFKDTTATSNLRSGGFIDSQLLVDEISQTFSHVKSNWKCFWTASTRHGPTSLFIVIKTLSKRKKKKYYSKKTFILSSMAAVENRFEVEIMRDRKIERTNWNLKNNFNFIVRSLLRSYVESVEGWKSKYFYFCL